ncbi:MAG: tRNA pseudouridine(55) synthase TruB [Candidatus Dadabacteria bacterium]|nr:tRNA pseudouridine(55) synthase TruB [Candidatus Dadabacteria bacterium]NIS09747.1 tRNA pseudouridine(55) synthase TruB [Candidatus Dadabacteria bacterium]NIV41112.1 tRNA pseudouridine(55) synthase TruB [Candidatus Dadabacteria bacterium]NIX16205.1 tRNA pseudouridine(55) synthase TruB [Candidatus Dadabacteria bacterium]NIY22828.1 tRNA pseudouridine(55) synthase TruB [Candidatus Dadabacteria bacterium]
MNSILIVDKPPNITSTKALDRVKRTLGARKAGHTGTLDPFATGVLTVCLNEATKLIPFLNENVKEYEAVLKLGQRTNTLDLTGEVTDTVSEVDVSISDINNVINKYVGDVEQEPPDFSAVKIEGRRLYNYARKKIKVNKPKRKIHIEKIEILDYYKPFVRFVVRCSKGTYIRSLADDIGEDLKVFAHLVELKRVKSGVFCINNSYSLDDIERGEYQMIAMSEAISDIKSLNINKDNTYKIKSGITLRKGDLNSSSITDISRDEVIKVLYDNNLICIAKSLVSQQDLVMMDDSEEIIKILRVFN